MLMAVAPITYLYCGALTSLLEAGDVHKPAVQISLNVGMIFTVAVLVFTISFRSMHESV